MITFIIIFLIIRKRKNRVMTCVNPIYRPTTCVLEVGGGCGGREFPPSGASSGGSVVTIGTGLEVEGTGEGGGC